jgi:formimidoylglutamate deiminase
MTSLFAPVALLPEGWAREVRVALDDGGRIAEVAAGATPEPADRVLAGRALLPAPANLHSHAFQRGLAGLAERPGDGPDSFWTWRAAMYRFLERLTPADVEAIAAMVQVEMAEAGFAAVGEFHYLHHAPDGAAYAGKAAMSRAIAAAAHETGLGLTHLPVLYSRGGVDERPVAGGQRRFANDLDGFAALLVDVEAAFAGMPADTRLGVAPHSLRAVRADEVGALAALRPGWPFHTHAAEQPREVAEIEASLGARPVRWLLDNQPVDANWCLIHATQMARDETAALAASGAVVGLCPLTEANLGDGVFDGARYLAAGGRFGIGSDSHIRIALAEELRQLEGSQRLRDGARNVLAVPPRSTGRTLFDAICSGGAQALGRDAGAIAAGRWADLVTLDLAAPTLAGLAGDRLLDGWLLAGDDGLVRDVWSAGREIVTDGRHPRREAVARRFAEVVTALRSAV